MRQSKYHRDIPNDTPIMRNPSTGGNNQMNQHEETLFTNIKSELRQLKSEVAQLLSTVIEAEADIDWHFDQYNESVGNSELSPKKETP